MSSGNRHAEIAHILRRATFGPHPGNVEKWVEPGPEALIDSLLSGSPQRILPAAEPAAEPGDERWDDVVKGFFTNMHSANAGLHEKMTWFWHGHLTSSDQKGGPLAIYRQHKLVRSLALGNFRELLRRITIDAAMLRWLDGNESRGDAPNENYSRELMELFTLGPGNYSEADVRAGAKLLAGWEAHWPSQIVRFRPASAYKGKVRFLGRKIRAGKESYSRVVDAVCDHPKCAPFIASKIHEFLIGVAPDPVRTDKLAEVFRDSGLEILPLLREIMTHPDFLNLRLNRPRYAIEWTTAAAAVLGRSSQANIWAMTPLGQTPFRPPNAAGWPPASSYLSSQQMLSRLDVLGWNWTEENSALGQRLINSDDPAEEVLQIASLYEVSDTTRAGLVSAARRAQPWDIPNTMLRLALTSPEFVIA